MLIGGYKQSGGEKALNQGQMLATVLVRGKNGLQFKQPNLQKTRKRWDYSGTDRIIIKKDLQIKICKSFIMNGGPSRDRTEDLLIKSQLLYQLS